MTTALTVYRRSELEGADCLHRYKAIWIDGVDDNSDYALRGQAFAAIKHAYIERLLANGLDQDEEESREAFREGIATSRCPDRLIPEVRELWDNHAQYFALRRDRFVAAEEKQLPIMCLACRKDWYLHEVKTEGASACPSCGSDKLEVRPFQFTPDLVYAHPEGNILEIVDDKTFFVALTEAQAKASFQGRFYTHYGMQRWPGFSTYRFTFNFVRFGKQVSVDYTPDDLATLEREVEAAVAKIEHARQENYWPATAGPSCAYCQLACPLANSPAIVPKRFTVPEQAVAVGGWILAAETQLKAAKKALKGYCATNGAVSVQGVEWDNRPTLQRAYPLEAVIEALNRAKVGRDAKVLENAGQVFGLTLSHSALASLFKEYPEIEKGLLPVQQSKTTYRFSARKPGMGDDDEN